MKWWVETFLNTEQDAYSLWVLAKTNYADHLFLSWSYRHPARQPILVVVRGVHKRCGYKYIWDTPNIVEQNTTGDTLVHQFHLTSLEAPSHIWFYLWAPDGPYGLEIQSPLHRADLSPVIAPVPWLQWVFLTTMEGWRTTLGSANWYNDGAPAPGCVLMVRDILTSIVSPPFNGVPYSHLWLDFYHYSARTGYHQLIIECWDGSIWAPVDTVDSFAHPWTLSPTYDLTPFINPAMQIRLRKMAYPEWRIDTVTIYRPP